MGPRQRQSSGLGRTTCHPTRERQPEHSAPETFENWAGLYFRNGFNPLPSHWVESGFSEVKALDN